MKLRLRIGALLKERGMTVAQLAEAADIAPNTARGLARGVNERIDLPVLQRVAEALGVRPLALFEEVEDAQGNRAPSFARAA